MSKKKHISCQNALKRAAGRFVKRYRSPKNKKELQNWLFCFFLNNYNIMRHAVCYEIGRCASGSIPDEDPCPVTWEGNL